MLINTNAIIGPIIILVKTAIFTLTFLKSNLVFESWTPSDIKAIGTISFFTYSKVGRIGVEVISTFKYLSKSARV